MNGITSTGMKHISTMNIPNIKILNLGIMPDIN